MLIKEPMWYVWIYSSLALSYGVFSGIRAFVLSRGNIKGIATLHENMMKRLLNAPINKFFQRVPVGRILNRFSEDMNTCDLSIPFAIGSVLVTGYLIIGNSILLVYLSHYLMTPIMVILLIFQGYITKSYLESNREFVRLERVSKSPVISFFTETLQGLSQIRAFKQQKRFLNKHYKINN